MTLGNFTDHYDQDLDCPQFSEKSMRMAGEFSFWVEGVSQVIDS